MVGEKKASGDAEQHWCRIALPLASIAPGSLSVSRNNNNKMSRFEGVIQVHRLMRTSNFLGAVREITRVLPNVSDVRLAVQLLHLRSGCFDKLDRYHEALVDCRRASLLDPTHADVYARRGYICNKLGWHHQAIDAFTSALNCGVPEESFLNNRYDPGSGSRHIEREAFNAWIGESCWS